VPRQAGERGAVEVGGEIGAHHVAGPLADVLRPAPGVKRRHLVDQDLDLLGTEQTGEKQVAVAFERVDLGWRKLHGRSPGTHVS